MRRMAAVAGTQEEVADRTSGKQEETVAEIAETPVAASGAADWSALLEQVPIESTRGCLLKVSRDFWLIILGADDLNSDHGKWIANIFAKWVTTYSSHRARNVFLFLNFGVNSF